MGTSVRATSWVGHANLYAGEPGFGFMSRPGCCLNRDRTLRRCRDAYSTIDALATMLHMKRVQIQFTDEMAAALQHLAAETDQPVTAIVRGAVERILAESERDRLWERALAAVGGFNSGLGDVAENHDKYLNEGPRW